MVIVNEKTNEDVDESRIALGAVKKQGDSNSLVKLKLLLQGAPLATERQGYGRIGMVQFL